MKIYVKFKNKIKFKKKRIQKKKQTNNQSICLFWNVQEESHNHCHSPALEYIFDVKCWEHTLGIERKNVAQMRPDTK